MTQLIQDWITQQAERRPERNAIVWKDERVSYAELDSITNRLAEMLRESGCHKGDRVAFCIPKSPAAIICMVGILKADCVYVPIDSECPAPRVVKVIESCRPRWILAARSAAKLLEGVFADANLTSSIRVGSLDDDHIAGDNFESEICRTGLMEFSDEPHAYHNHSDDPAHILFTSGSTGIPKGVVITHANVISFVEWGVNYLGIDDTDRVSGHAPLHFDLSTFDMYGAFAAGAELHPVPPELNLLPNKVADFIRNHDLTQWFSVPSILNYLCKFDVVDFNDFPSLRRLMWCGEVLPTPTLMYLMKRLPSIPFTNLYGPTEATIASSYHTVESCPENETDSVPIGMPCDGESLLVLDEKLQPVDNGTTGDLYIGGIGLSPGYWRDQEKTDSVFLANPGNGERIYKTGDLAYVGEDGLVYFIGRSDTQIKSRGYRIELGEIETGLSAIEFLDESAVVAIDTDGFQNKSICCAYVPSSDAEVTPARIRTALLKAVPKYMVPTQWMEFEELPKNTNGKIHRPQLHESFTEQHNNGQTVAKKSAITTAAD